MIDNTTLKTSGFWSCEENKLHINFMELKAVFLSLKCFCSTKTNIHIRLYLDNMVAVYYIDKMGGRIESLNNLTKDIWQWCIKRDIWLSVCHLPGKVNIDIDLFALRINHQLPHYVSYLPDPNAEFIDAFSLKWIQINVLLFLLLA